MQKTFVTAMLMVLLGTRPTASDPVEGTYMAFRGVVVARSVTECRFDGGPGRCTENYLVNQIFPNLAPRSSAKYLIVVREFDDREPHPSDTFLVNRELSFSTVRDSTCDRLVTYQPRGWACGPSGGTRTYDWRKLVTKHGHPSEGDSVSCVRLVTPIPELGLQ